MEPRMEGEPQADNPSVTDKDGRSLEARRDSGTPPAGGVLPGLFLARVSAIYLFLGAVLLVIAVLLMSAIAGWYISFLSREIMTARFIVALLLAQMIILIGTGWAARLLWQRGRAVMALRKGERMASRVMVVLLRSGGEVGALLLMALTLSLGLLVMIAPDSLLKLSPWLMQSLEWLSVYPRLLQWTVFILLGLAIIALGASMAAMMLLISGFFAEGLALMLQVADDTRRAREQLETFKGSDEVLRAFR